MFRCPACSTENPADARFCNGCGSRLTAAAAHRRDHRGAQGRSPRSSATSSASPRRARAPIPKTSTGCSPATSPWPGRRSSSTAASSRSSSAMRSSGCSASRSPTRTIRSERSGRPSGSPTRPRGLRGPRRRAAPAPDRDQHRPGPRPPRSGPGAGERFLAGDSVNTASRIQSVAPELGVAVGRGDLARRRSTGSSTTELPPGGPEGQGRAGPRLPRDRPALVARRRRDPRPRQPVRRPGIELGTLVGALDTPVADEPLEFVDDRRRAGARQEPARRGAPGARRRASAPRHLAPGPLPPVRLRDRVLGARRDRQGPRRDPRVGPAVGRHRQARRRPARGRRAAWFRERLLPLLGIESGSRAGREEQFTAWRRFLELLADAAPDRSRLRGPPLGRRRDARVPRGAGAGPAVPLLVVGTTRPELLDGGRTSRARPSAVRIMLEPLPLRTTRPRACSPRCSRRPRSRRALLEPILERAAGNPLFAEEFVRLLRDRDLLVDRGRRHGSARRRRAPVPRHDPRPPRRPHRRAAGGRRRRCSPTLR